MSFATEVTYQIIINPVKNHSIYLEGPDTIKL